MTTPDQPPETRGVIKLAVEALKASPALLALMLFMSGTLYLIHAAGVDNRALMKTLVELCVHK